MHFTTLLTALVAACGISALPTSLVPRQAGVALTNGDYTGLAVGSPFTITWAGNTGAVDLTLLSGPAENVQPVGALANGLWANEFTWYPASSGMYAFQISDSTGTINYSPQFWVGASLARRDWVAFTNDNFNGLTVGVPFTITWTGSGTITLTLKSGPADNLQPIGQIASDTWGNSFTWTPAAEGTYALEIADSNGGVNYSPQFWVGSGLARRDWVAFTNDNFSGLAVGVPFEITWSGSGAVTLTLKSGSAEDLQPVGQISSATWGNSFVWTPASQGMYALEITDASGGINYSPLFWVQ